MCVGGKMKIVNCKKATKIKDHKKDLEFVMPREYIGTIPEWVEKHPYFDLLCKDGTITFVENSSDKSLEKADAESKEKQAKKDKIAEAKRENDEKKA